MLAQFQEEKGKRYEVSVGRVDAKKDYGGKCPGFLTARLQDGKIKKNNVVVINCARKDHPFTVNVPVNVTVLREVTVAKDNIPRGSVISEDLIDTVFIPETANTAATITDIRSIVGAKARKDIKAGEQLKNQTSASWQKVILFTLRQLMVLSPLKPQVLPCRKADSMRIFR